MQNRFFLNCIWFFIWGDTIFTAKKHFRWSFIMEFHFEMEMRTCRWLGHSSSISQTFCSTDWPLSLAVYIQYKNIFILQGPNLPQQHFPGAQFATESARGPICLKPVLKTRVCNGIHRFQSWLESRQTRRSLYFQLGWSCFAVINITMIIITMIISTKIISTITSLILLMILSLNKRGRAPTSSLGEVVSEREEPLLGYIIYNI